MRILTKYVLKEHIGPLMFALCALTSLLLLNYIAKQLTNLAGKGLEWQVIAEFLILSLPFTIAMTLPMAVLVASLYAFSRLAAENEIPAMKANGVSMGSLLLPVVIGAVVLAVAMVAFNDQVLPRANHRLATLQRDIARKRPTFALREQVLNEVLPDRGLSLRTDAIDRGRNTMRNVHIYDVSQFASVRTIHADSGELYLTADQHDLVLRLYDGYVLDVDKADPTMLNRVYFTVNQMRVRGVGNELNRVTQDGQRGEREQSICDMTDNYEQARTKAESERLELEDRLLHLIRQAVAGQDFVYMPPDERPPVPEEHSWGSVYCTGITALGGALGIEPDTTLSPADSAAAAEARLNGSSADASPAVGDLSNTANAAAGAAVDASAATGTSSADAGAVIVQELPGATLSPGVTAALPAAQAPPPPLIDPDLHRPRYGAIGLSGFTESISAELDGLNNRMVNSRRSMNRFSVEIHKKFSLAAACIVFVLIGAPFALRFPRGGVGLVIGASLVIFAISYVGLIAGESLADRATLSPFLAMWGANFLLAFIGILMIMRMGRESVTRGSSIAALIDDFRNWRDQRRARKNGGAQGAAAK